MVIRVKQSGGQKEPVRVLGIDPGLALTGYALLESNDRVCRVEDFGCIQTSARLDLPQRLLSIFDNVCALIDRFNPGTLAVEQLFFCKNVRTATQVGEARGAVLTAAATRGTLIAEYTPLQVKQAITGYGKADKKQVQQMVTIRLGLPEPPEPDDAADALAVALCYLQHRDWYKAVEKGR